MAARGPELPVCEYFLGLDLLLATLKVALHEPRRPLEAAA